MRHNIRANQGFTLLEVMLVMAILVVIASLSLRFTSGVVAHYRLRQSSDDIRAEWTWLRSKAMEDGQIYCFRFSYSENVYRVDRVLDAHFTAKFDEPNRANYSDDPIWDKTIDPDELTREDYFLPDPDMEYGQTPIVLSQKTELPKNCFFADGYVKPDARGRYYEGTDNYSFSSGTWSQPILFYPDGTTSTATILIKNEQARCIELHLRGLTGAVAVSAIGSETSYEGYLDVTATRNMP
ncbi:MAG: prepilin-type N-terminal cleavage/methylation domain-containing protein [Planctomycetaceae bacterium]|nr:prepilin-type N-terminal cleavage/methylation domain-containing protein [Planctomycetaceae bacterium]